MPWVRWDTLQLFRWKQRASAHQKTDTSLYMTAGTPLSRSLSLSLPPPRAFVSVSVYLCLSLSLAPLITHGRTPTHHIHHGYRRQQEQKRPLDQQGGHPRHVVVPREVREAAPEAPPVCHAPPGSFHQRQNCGHEGDPGALGTAGGTEVSRAWAVDWQRWGAPQRGIRDPVVFYLSVVDRAGAEFKSAYVSLETRLEGHSHPVGATGHARAISVD